MSTATPALLDRIHTYIREVAEEDTLSEIHVTYLHGIPEAEARKILDALVDGGVPVKVVPLSPTNMAYIAIVPRADRTVFAALPNFDNSWTVAYETAMHDITVTTKEVK